MKIAYSIKEVANTLGCGMNTTYELVHSGELASFKIGRKIMIPTRAVEEFVNNKLKAQT